MRPLTILITIAALFVLLAWPETSRMSIAAVNVKGRIELLNSKTRGRQSRVDAGGIVVWLNPIDGATLRGQRQKRTITQRNKRFSPHVVAVEIGAEVDFPNEDPFFHNVFSIYNGKRFDLGLYASGETRPVNFNRPGVSYIFCNIHPQMSAIVVTLSTPWFAVSDQQGNFMINNVPDGRYRLGVWHERAMAEALSAIARTVQISASNADLGVIQISEEGYIPRPHPNKHGQEYDKEQIRPGYRKP
jgi:plastocyanin